MILSGLVDVVNLHDDGEDGMGTRRGFVHRRGTNRAHFVPLFHQAIDALLVRDNCLSQVLETKNQVVRGVKLRVEVPRGVTREASYQVG